MDVQGATRSNIKTAVGLKRESVQRGKIDSISKIGDRWSLNKESDFTKDREGLIILQGKRKDSTRLNMWCVCKQIFKLTH